MNKFERQEAIHKIDMRRMDILDPATNECIRDILGIMQSDGLSQLERIQKSENERHRSSGIAEGQVGEAE